MLIGTNVVVAVVLIGTGLVYGYARYRLDSIRTGSGAGLSATDGSPGGSKSSRSAQSAGGLAPENILLIGNQTRAGQTQVNFGNAAQLSGTLSDIVMILHLDPKADTASIISIPRDVFVPMPAGSQVSGYQKIDAALNDGPNGPNNLAEAITQDFGIPINHYVEVDFDGFLQTVDALGGIKVDFPERLYDLYAGLNITQTGCQLLDGQQALAMVRSRHLQYDPPGVNPFDHYAWPYDPESDLARIVRDHTFIRILASTAESEGLTNPIKANNFLGAVLGQLTVDPGLKNQLISLIGHYHHLNPFASPETTIPVTQITGNGSGYVFDGYNVGDVEFPDQPADTQAIAKWDAGALPTPVTPTAVQVYNDTGTGYLAADTGSSLEADGLPVTVETDGSVPGTESETVVQYHPGQLAMGYAVFSKLGGAVILQSDAAVAAGTVDVQAGSTLAVQTLDVPVATPASPSSTGAAASTPTTVAPSTAGSAATGSPTTGSPTTSSPTTVPTPGGQVPSSSADATTPYDPRPC